jgi:hypothetical protein
MYIRARARAHTHTHTQIYIYIYVCECMYNIMNLSQTLINTTFAYYM